MLVHEYFYFIASIAIVHVIYVSLFAGSATVLPFYSIKQLDCHPRNMYNQPTSLYHPKIGMPS